jgi:hypothetical protein
MFDIDEMYNHLHMYMHIYKYKCVYSYTHISQIHVHSYTNTYLRIS